MVKAYKIHILLSVLLIGIYLIFKHNNEYMKDKWVDVTLLQEYTNERRTKGYSSVEPVFVLALDNGYVFDQRVSYSTAYKYNVGDRFKMYLREMDIKQTYWNNTIYFFFYVLVFTVMIAQIILTIGVLIFNNKSTVRIFDDK